MGIPITFSVDAACAGEGTLELVVSTETSTVKAEVMACARGLYDVTFVPQSVELHFVNITFNDIAVGGSPFKVEVQQNIQHTQLGNISIVELMSENQTLEITGPDNKPIPFISNKKLAEFQTQHIGTYIIRYIDRETRTVVATRTVNVFDPTMVKIMEVGVAYCHRPAIIVVSVIDAGQGTLSAIVKCGRNEVPHSIRGPTKNGTWEIVYHPTKLAPHKMNIMYNSVPISVKGMEINILPAANGKEISVSGMGLYQSRVGKTTTFSIDTTGRQAREFDVVISGPQGIALPVRCYQTKSGHLIAEYTSPKIGQCLIGMIFFHNIPSEI
jgi:filamin